MPNLYAPLRSRESRKTTRVSQESVPRVGTGSSVIDQRPEAAQLRTLIHALENSPRVLQQKALVDGLHHSKTAAVQRMMESDDVESAEQEKKDTGLNEKAQDEIRKKIKLYEAAHAREGTRKGDQRTPEQIDNARSLLRECINELEAASRGGIGPHVVNAVASLAAALLNEYPPERYTYVMLGNSPAPLMAWLQLKGCETFHLPLGGLTTPDGQKAMEDAGAEAVNDRIGRYLDQALRGVKERGLPIVVVDYVSTGESLATTAKWIGKWSGMDVETFGYSEKSPQALAAEDSSYEGTLATSTGVAERVFTKLNADKVLKNALLFGGPGTLDIKDLLEGKGPTEQAQKWQRVLAVMRAALGSI